MKCIKCGSELRCIVNSPNEPIIGYKCPNCNLEWSLAEHKDNQNWAVRHIRALETRIANLELSMDTLLKKLGV